MRRNLSLILNALLVSCSTKIVCPPVSNGKTVALLDHGRHASLAVEDDNGGMARYAYGDWDYYALGENSFSNGLKALFLPTRSGMGWKKSARPLTRESIRIFIKEGVEEIFLLSVESHKLRLLREELDSIYRKNKATRHYNSQYDLNFVHYPKNYSAFNNSNRETVLWLEKLGCESAGPTLFSSWELSP